MSLHDALLCEWCEWHHDSTPAVGVAGDSPICRFHTTYPHWVPISHGEEWDALIAKHGQGAVLADHPHIPPPTQGEVIAFLDQAFGREGR